MTNTSAAKLDNILCFNDCRPHSIPSVQLSRFFGAAAYIIAVSKFKKGSVVAITIYLTFETSNENAHMVAMLVYVIEKTEPDPIVNNNTELLHTGFPIT